MFWDITPEVSATCSDVSPGDCSIYGSGTKDSWACADPQNNDCYMTLQFDDSHLITGFEITLDVSSNCIPAHYMLEYEVYVFLSTILFFYNFSRVISYSLYFLYRKICA